MSDYWDEAPYSMIGYQSTLPTDPKAKPNNRPIGFIWPKQHKRKTTRVGKPRASRPKRNR